MFGSKKIKMSIFGQKLKNQYLSHNQVKQVLVLHCLTLDQIIQPNF